MSKLTKAELSKYKKLLSLTRKDGSGEHFVDLEEFEDRMDKKYGSWSIIPVKKATNDKYLILGLTILKSK